MLTSKQKRLEKKRTSSFLLDHDKQIKHDNPKLKYIKTSEEKETKCLTFTRLT